MGSSPQSAGIAPHGGAGSGGAIYISCRRFHSSRTNALLSARGGNGPDNVGGGGGGRIALWRSAESLPAEGILMDASGGTGNGTNSGRDGSNGTVFLGWLPSSGSFFIVR